MNSNPLDGVVTRCKAERHARLKEEERKLDEQRRERYALLAKQIEAAYAQSISLITWPEELSYEAVGLLEKQGCTVKQAFMEGRNGYKIALPM